MKIVSILIGLLLIIPLAFAEGFTEEVGYDIRINKDKVVAVKETTSYYKDNIVIGTEITDRQVFAPDLNEEQITSPKVQAIFQEVKPITNIIWTKEVKDAYKAKKAERELTQ